jgi:hypothetical protein
MAKVKTLEELFKLAGGSVHVASLLNLNQYSVDRWDRNGIPQKHWGKLAAKYGLDVDTLYAISQGCKK